MSINEAVRDLRTSLKLSQQAFATRLGLSISTIQNYEKERKPFGLALLRMLQLASETGYDKHAAVFRQAMADEFDLYASTTLREARKYLYALHTGISELFKPDLTQEELQTIRLYLMDNVHSLARQLDVHNIEDLAEDLRKERETE